MFDWCRGLVVDTRAGLVVYLRVEDESRKGKRNLKPGALRIETS